MKKITFLCLFILALTLLCSVGAAAENADSIALQIGNPIMTVNEKQIQIDKDGAVSPVLIEGRTYLPVRAIMEAMGGTADWDDKSQTAVLSYDDAQIALKINSATAYFNGEEKNIEAAPVILNGRTMLPIRFIAESFGFYVEWSSAEQLVTISKSKPEIQNVTDVTKEHAEDRALIVYYSYSGNTRRVAERMAEVLGADRYEIKTVKAYPEDEYETAAVASEERRSGNLPQITEDFPDISQYEYIWIGGPVWNGEIAAPLAKYLACTDLRGKTVIPFWTNKGSGEQAYLRDFQQFVRDAEVTEGFGISFHRELTDAEIDDMITAHTAEILSMPRSK